MERDRADPEKSDQNELISPRLGLSRFKPENSMLGPIEYKPILEWITRHQATAQRSRVNPHRKERGQLELVYRLIKQKPEGNGRKKRVGGTEFRKLWREPVR
jgi:hypothetical protein